MEIERRSIHKSMPGNTAAIGFVAEEDYNLPEYKPDIVSVLKCRGTVEVGDAAPEEGAWTIQGKVFFEIMYQGESGKIDVLTGSMPFQERAVTENAGRKDDVFLKAEVEDMGVVVINSRKLSLRSICSLQMISIGREEAELPVAPAAGEDEQVLLEERTVLKLMEQRKDRVRFRQELTLPKEKPNIQNVVWKEIHLEQINIRQSGDGLEISGMLSVFVLYRTGGEQNYVWYETSVPVSEHIACDLPKANGFYQLKPMGTQALLEAREDLDGEMRILHGECNMEVRISVWQEEEMELLKDAYSLSKELQIHCHEEELWQMAMKNEMSLPLEEELHLPAGKEATYLCNTEAVLKSVATKWKDDRIIVSGEWEIEVLYVTEEEDAPFACGRITTPFQGEMEAGRIRPGDYIDADASMYRLQCALGDSGRLLLRGEIMVALMAFHRETILLPDDVTEKEPDMDALQEQPGMIGYVVQEDDRLWDIAKKFHTTKQELMETNGLEQEGLRKGQKILVMKHIPMNV